ncbi:unnamed protein product [Absidia cylindrospora]
MARFFFTDEELEEIKSANPLDEFVLPEKLGQFFATVESSTSPMAAAKVAGRYDFDDVGDDEKDCYWAQLAIQHAASLFRKNGKVDFATMSAFDMLTGPWKMSIF